jgi:hypothetical protein
MNVVGFGQGGSLAGQADDVLCSYAAGCVVFPHTGIFGQTI